MGGATENSGEQLKLTNAHPGTVVGVIIPRSVSVLSEDPGGGEKKTAVLGTGSADVRPWARLQGEEGYQQ